MVNGISKIVINGMRFSVVDDKLVSKDLELTKLEQKALLALIGERGAIISKKDFTERVWGHIHVSDSSLRKLISVLRQKINDKEGEALITERGAGYRLSFEIDNRSDLAQVSKVSGFIRRRTIIAASFLLLSVMLMISWNLSDDITVIETPEYTTIGSFSSGIMRHQIYNNAHYFLPESSSKKVAYIKKVEYGIAEEVFRIEESSAYLQDFSISPGGKSLIRVNHPDHCEITFFNGMFNDVHSKLPCYKLMQHSSYVWLDDNRVLFTHKVDSAKPVRPYIYNLSTKTVEKLDYKDIGYNESTDENDLLVRPYKDGIFVARITSSYFDDIEIHYFSKNTSKLVTRQVGFEFDVSDDGFLVNINSSNEVQVANIQDIEKDNFEFSYRTVINGAPNISYQPLLSDGQLYFLNGTQYNTAIFCSGTNALFLSEDGVISATPQELMLLRKEQAGVNLLQISSDLRQETSIKTDLNFTLANKFDDSIYLAGKSGLYQYTKGTLVPIFDKPVTRMVGGRGIVVQSEGNIFEYDGKNVVMKVAGASQLSRMDTGYIYRVNLTGEVRNQDGMTMGFSSSREFIFSAYGKVIVPERSIEGKIEFYELGTRNLVITLEHPFLNFQFAHWNGDIYYESFGESFNSIVKVEGNLIKEVLKSKFR